jgi:uncharacterized cupin superfamily protein
VAERSIAVYGEEDEMELHPGVFVVKAATKGWEPDPDVPGSEMRELVRADGVWAGLTRFTQVDGPVPWRPERREIALILEGSVRIEIAAGGVLELGVGDLFSLPPGVETTWHVTTPFKEAWVLAD